MTTSDSDRGRTLHLGVNVTGLGGSTEAWRRPTVDPLGGSTSEFFVNAARLAEKGLFDAFFLADVPSLRADVAHQPPGQSLDPLVALSVVAEATERIGLVATISTTWHHPYNLARSLLSLDRVSHGRAGWNVVTNHTPSVGLNYGLAQMPSKQERYSRADEFLEVVLGLWQTWAPDSIIADKRRGVFADPTKVTRVEHHGRHFSVVGGSTVPPSEQVYPVLFQAGGSALGLALAAKYADAVFIAASGAEVADSFAADLRAAGDVVGRTRTPTLVLPGLVLGVASTDAEAAGRTRELRSEKDLDDKIAFLAGRLGIPPEALDLDRPIPVHLVDVERQAAVNSEGFLTSTLALARTGKPLREILAEGNGAGHFAISGGPRTVADEIERWFARGSIDGFNLMFDVLDEGLPIFVDEVVPILQERGLYRRSYAGSTLREHLGIGVPGRHPVAALP